MKRSICKPLFFHFLCQFQGQPFFRSSIRENGDQKGLDGSFSKGIKSFQEEFFDNTNDEIVGMFFKAVKELFLR